MADLNSKIEMIITSREKDLGGFTVRRILPYASHRMVGPFIFFDHMGPATFKPGEGMDVRPHPHINLSTVSYLFEGKIEHRDSLGSDQLIEPGAVNWMTAGRGIVHSERTPAPERKKGGRMHGIQLWVALPQEVEESAPSFSHHPRETLPEFEVNDVHIKLLLGRLFGQLSPVKIHSDLFYAEIKMKAGQNLMLPVEGRESAIYSVQGQLQVEDQLLNSTDMAIGKRGADLSFTALDDCHLMVLGGLPLGDRKIFWNFVSSSPERIEAAKREWKNGPSSSSLRFSPIPGDAQEYIPLPQEVPAKGTIM